MIVYLSFFVAVISISLFYRANAEKAKSLIGKISRPGTFLGLKVSLSAFLLNAFLLTAFPQMPDALGILVVLLFVISTFAAMAFTSIFIITSMLG